MSSGMIDTLVDEDKYQEYQRMKANERNAEAEQTSGEESVGGKGSDGGLGD